MCEDKEQQCAAIGELVCGNRSSYPNARLIMSYEASWAWLTSYIWYCGV